MKGRTYRYMSNPLFPFGFGLSYTGFSIGTARVNKPQITSGDNLQINIPISNIGKRNGTEVVQVYIRRMNDAAGPLKTLKGFQKLHIDAGKNGTATISLPYESFEFFDAANGRMAVQPGNYELLYGSSSADKDLKRVQIRVQ
jgi:beta-glucosidase